VARKPTSKLVYQGSALRIEFYVAISGEVPAEDWLENLSEVKQQKFAAVFAWMADQGKIWNERKFKHLTGSDQIFEFKSDDGRDRESRSNKERFSGEGEAMKETKKQVGWLDKKLANPKFRKAFRQEYEKLSIGEQLLRLRLDAGMTQAEVAKKVGTTASAISRYENAEYDRYELQTLRKIVEACGGVLHISMSASNKERAA
jgi:DNA-binding XRE family transcriptional regulator